MGGFLDNLKSIGWCTDLFHPGRKWCGRKIGPRRENWILWVSQQEITLRSFVTQETTLSEPGIRNSLLPFHPRWLRSSSSTSNTNKNRRTKRKKKYTSTKHKKLHLGEPGIRNSIFAFHPKNVFAIVFVFVFVSGWVGCELRLVGWVEVYFSDIVNCISPNLPNIFLHFCERYFPDLLLVRGSDLVAIYWMAGSCPPPLWTLERAWVAFTELLFEQNWPSFHYTAQFYREDVSAVLRQYLSPKHNILLSIPWQQQKIRRFSLYFFSSFLFF